MLIFSLRDNSQLMHRIKSSIDDASIAFRLTSHNAVAHCYKPGHEELLQVLDGRSCGTHTQAPDLGLHDVSHYSPSGTACYGMFYKSVQSFCVAKELFRFGFQWFVLC